MICLHNYSYNVEIAKIFGVKTSIFLTCINYAYSCQLNRHSLNANDTISLSRGEIYEVTGLSDDEQVDVELTLTECGVLSVKSFQNIPNKNYYILNETKLNDILNSDNPVDVIKSSSASQFIRGKRVEPVSKRQTYIASLKKKINVEDPVLQDYFVQWIDAVYSNPKGFLSPSGVVIAQQELMEYCRDNQDTQIKVLKEAIKGGLRDLTWAIQNYEKNNHIDSRNFANYSDASIATTLSNDEVF